MVVSAHPVAALRRHGPVARCRHSPRRSRSLRLGAPHAIFIGSGTAASNRRYVLTDERGSVTAMVNGATGAQTIANTYGPYGEPGASNSGPFGYTGQLWLSEAGLWFMRNRVYDPAIGRFLQTDPIGYAGGMNLYGYVGNDPTNSWDPLGLADPKEILVQIKKIEAANAAAEMQNAQQSLRDDQRGSDFGRIAGNEIGVIVVRGTQDTPPNDDSARLTLISGRSGPQSEENSASACLIFAGTRNGVNLALDAGGALLVLASAKFQVAAAIGGSILGLIGLGVSAANRDATGAGLAFAGKQAANASGIAQAGSALARGASRFGAAAVAASTARDLAQAYEDYQQCRAGSGQ